MRLTSEEKTVETFNRLRTISDNSFSGIERPPSGVFLSHYETDDVFVDDRRAEPIRGFCLVGDREGPYVWSIAVNPQYRGQGIGWSLLNEITDYYRGLGKEHITLTCHVDNPAQKLYYDNGYRVVRVVQRYYGADNGLFMKKIL
jgi:ribosomal-protein-alanine N-acetyltransferase